MTFFRRLALLPKCVAQTPKTDDLTMSAASRLSPNIWIAGAFAILLAACQSTLTSAPVSVEPDTASVTNIDSLSAVIAREPNNPEAHYTRGTVRQQNGDADGAPATMIWSHPVSGSSGCPRVTATVRAAITVLGFTFSRCSSRRTGITCQHDASRQGFSIASGANSTY